MRIWTPLTLALAMTATLAWAGGTAVDRGLKDPTPPQGAGCLGVDSCGELSDMCRKGTDCTFTCHIVWDGCFVGSTSHDERARPTRAAVS